MPDERFSYRVPRVHGPRIAVIGGGNGLSTMLRGLKNYTENITAIVTVADDGGGSGMLREDLIQILVAENNVLLRPAPVYIRR